MRPPRLKAVLIASGLAAAPAAAQTPGAVDAGDVTGMILSLIAVLVLILAAAWVFKRAPFSLTARADGPLRVVASLPLGPKERLVLVSARGREVLVAVGPAGIAILDTATETPAAEAGGPGSGGVGEDALRLAARFGRGRQS